MRVLIFLLGAVATTSALADGGALARSFALPVLGQAEVTPPGKSRTTAELDLTNEFVSKATPAESILLDGESARLTLSYHGGDVQDWDWKIGRAHV